MGLEGKRSGSTTQDEAEAGDGRAGDSDAEHELVVDRGAAIDVAKAAGKVCVRLPGKSGRRFSRVWDVPARTGAITELAEQLVELGIEKVTVESTSDYWRIWYYLLEDAGLDVQLVNSREERARSAQNRQT